MVREAIAKRDCQRARDQKTGQEALATNIAPPGCDALDSNSNDWILMLDVGSLQSDDAGIKALINSGAALSACPSSQCGDDSVRRGTPGAAPFRAATGAIIKRYGDRTGNFDDHGIWISSFKLQSCRSPSSQCETSGTQDMRSSSLLKILVSNEARSDGDVTRSVDSPLCKPTPRASPRSQRSTTRLRATRSVHGHEAGRSPRQGRGKATPARPSART